MNRDFYNVLRVVIWITLFIVIGKLFFRLLPWLIVVGVIIWAVKKMMKFFQEKKQAKQTVHCESKQSTDTENKNVIDVDYTEIK